MALELPKASKIQKEKFNANSSVKNTIVVMSGKGGVGKSSVTALLATVLADNGFKVGILDADITGPSIPKIFGLSGQKSYMLEEGIAPLETRKGIKTMSVNLVIENEDDPVIWRAPIITSAIKQFYSDVYWGELDYLLIDMPPGTGDVPLTVMESLHVDGVVIVSSPQDLVRIIVKKSMNMVKKMNVKMLGVVENMSYFKCPDNGKKYEIFGKSILDKVAEEFGTEVIGRIPIDPELSALSDFGALEDYTDGNEDINTEFAIPVLKGLKVK